MKKLRFAAAVYFAAAAAYLLGLSAFAEGAQEFTPEDRLIFGVFPLWGFLLLLAGIVLAAIVIIVEVFKRKMK